MNKLGTLDFQYETAFSVKNSAENIFLSPVMIIAAKKLL